MALAGGGSLLALLRVNPWWFLIHAWRYQTFHDNADGYVCGEEVGVVVLKRLEGALDERENILGVVRGSGRNYGGDASSMMHPSENSRQQLYRNVLEQRDVDADSISYVETHRIGPQAGGFTRKHLHRSEAQIIHSLLEL
ncbi:hypothetical protein J3459_018097 [Metarhizium acridum]|uniref:Polyketide synthase, putative n=1 Tax=Metarhizium acridum (strain CQMa 102) TaxID=655827 RepID=E9DQX5_METAQ|nr:polyketide synthase, putative [Metarhizium acridum CQMa 102]EFY93653.1 polyketide synthase, putative [Metarhizium acridum CQMa 102]KAG8408236.1 hypothetical protein J3459_018097 [Metarhizium acridum]KAG8410263.1 hypothetical protein J3458_017978 [Metarhizium acridum]